jgi:hypothetical protein
VFRVLGDASLAEELDALTPVHLLTARLEDQAVCLATVSPEALPAFRERVLALADAGTVTRVEAEPRL